MSQGAIVRVRHLRWRLLQAFEDARTETSRLGWEPYMHDPALPHLLRGIKTPVLLVRGSNTEPIVRAIAEAPSAAEAQALCNQAADVLKSV